MQASPRCTSLVRDLEDDLLRCAKANGHEGEHEGVGRPDGPAGLTRRTWTDAEAIVNTNSRRTLKPSVTRQDHVFAERLCEALGVEPSEERVKALAKLRAEEHEVAVSCAVVRMERIFDVQERESEWSIRDAKAKVEEESPAEKPKRRKGERT